VGIRDLFKIVCVHNMMNNLLPARTGEVSYIYLINKVHERDISEGIATLVVARVFDFIVISGIFFVQSCSYDGCPILLLRLPCMH